MVGIKFFFPHTLDIQSFPWPPEQEPSKRKGGVQGGGDVGTSSSSGLTSHIPPTWEEAHKKEEAIALAARELNEKRERWLNPSYPTPGPSPSKATERGEKARTLTNLYNQRPTWLLLAHEKLDRAVFAAYGWEWRSPNGGLSEEEVLGRLLEENLRRGG